MVDSCKPDRFIHIKFVMFLNKMSSTEFFGLFAFDSMLFDLIFI